MALCHGYIISDGSWSRSNPGKWFLFVWESESKFPVSCILFILTLLIFDRRRIRKKNKNLCKVFESCRCRIEQVSQLISLKFCQLWWQQLPRHAETCCGITWGGKTLTPPSPFCRSRKILCTFRANCALHVQTNTSCLLYYVILSDE